MGWKKTSQGPISAPTRVDTPRSTGDTPCAFLRSLKTAATLAPQGFVRKKNPNRKLLPTNQPRSWRWAFFSFFYEGFVKNVFLGTFGIKLKKFRDGIGQIGERHYLAKGWELLRLKFQRPSSIFVAWGVAAVWKTWFVEKRGQSSG